MKAIEVGKVRESEEEVEINGMGGVGKNKTVLQLFPSSLIPN